jgi:aryl-alcohol dehydrogenase-like predicted oxidoreductase
MELRELGIGIVPYSPIARGFFGGRGVTEQVSAESNLVQIQPVVSVNSLQLIWPEPLYYILVF